MKSIDDDPWDWDLARVVKELCTDERTWTPPRQNKIPDLVQLQRNIEKFDLEGEALLRFGEGDVSVQELMKDLGLKTFPHRMFFTEAMRQFRSRSRQYRAWKRLLKSDELELDTADDGSQVISKREFSTLLGELNSLKRQLSEFMESSRGEDKASPISPPATDGNMKDVKGLSQPSFFTTDQRAAEIQLLQEAGLTPAIQPPTLTSSEPVDAPEDNSSQPPPTKRRRVELTLVSAVPTRTVPVEVPFYLDSSVAARTVTGPTVTQSHSEALKCSYLGRDGLTLEDMFDPDQSSDDESLESFVLGENNRAGGKWEFSFLRTNQQPPGRVLQVKKAMQKYLHGNLAYNKSSGIAENGEAYVKAGFDSDSDEEYDEETWALMQEEQAEREARAKEEELKRLKEPEKCPLMTPEVEAIIEEAIQDYENDWNEGTRPVQLFKANKLWNDARRQGTRHIWVSRAVKMCRQLDDRIESLKGRLLSNQWFDKESLRYLMDENVQPSVRDRMAERLRLRILNSPAEPKKPTKVSKPTPSSKKRMAPIQEEEDVEILDSDTEEDLDKFIVHDNDSDVGQDQPMGEEGSGVSGDSMDIEFGPVGPVETVSDGDDATDLMNVDDPARPHHDEQGGQDTPATGSMSSEPSAIIDDATASPTDAESVRLESTTPVIESGTDDQNIADRVQASPINAEMDAGKLGDGELNADRNVQQSQPPVTPMKSSKRPRPRPTPKYESPDTTSSQDDIAFPLNRDTDEDNDNSDNSSQNVPAEIPPMPSSDDIFAIAKLGADYWSADRWGHDADVRRGLLILMLYHAETATREQVFRLVESDKDTDSLWREQMGVALDKLQRTLKAGKTPTGYGRPILQLFHVWLDRGCPTDNLPQVWAKDLETIRDRKPFFDAFRQDVKSLIPGFRDLTDPTAAMEGSSQSRVTKVPRVNSDPEAETEVTGASDRGSLIMEDDKDAPHPTPMSAKSFAEKIDEMADKEVAGSESDDMPMSVSKKKRRRKVAQDRAAANHREQVMQTNEELEERRHALRENLAHSGVLPENKVQYIINETKEQEDGLVYITESIRRFIKAHQIEGVRFMWDHLVAKPAKERKGCLLAHTMGLGKTMQVITVLYAIAEAAQSPDQTISKQIPENLRRNKTLVLCPAGLVDNWNDEFLKWTPTSSAPDAPPLGLLGHIYKCESAQSLSQRETIVRKWDRTGGILVIGYEMFRTFFFGKTKESLSDDDSDDPQTLSKVSKILHEAPSIVIADEAHKFKNPKSKIHQSVVPFRTKCRIALTGTPLANNVLDYYAMIDWVSPNYLGPVAEFNQEFNTPISQGLWADDDPHSRKRALKRLSVLKSTVAPLVHRRDILTLKHDLSQKREFVLYLNWTPLQKRAYSSFLERVVHNPEARTWMTGGNNGNTMNWSFVSFLGRILAHPSIYVDKLVEKPKPRRNGATTRIKEVDGDWDETATHNFPAHIKDLLLEDIPQAMVGKVDYDQSQKIVMLNMILDQCRNEKSKVLVFSQSIATLDYLTAMFRRQQRNFARLDGSTAINTRQQATKDFNTDGNAEVYLISTKAGGVGLNIQGANRVVVFDFKYVPMEEQQAIGRAYRIGQDKEVFVYWLIVGSTFEESIQNKSVFKQQLQSRVVDTKNPLPWAQRNKTLFPHPRDLEQEDLSEFRGQDKVLDGILNSPELQGSVRKIIATETFEEEVKDDELTADDREEIKQWIAMRKLRLENPNALLPSGLAMPGALMGGLQMPYVGTVPVPVPVGHANAQHASQWSGVSGLAKPAPYGQPNRVTNVYGQVVGQGQGPGEGQCESQTTLPFKAGSKSEKVLIKPIKIVVPERLRGTTGGYPSPYMAPASVPDPATEPGLPPMSLPSTGTVSPHFHPPQHYQPSLGPNGSLPTHDGFASMLQDQRTPDQQPATTPDTWPRSNQNNINHPGPAMEPIHHLHPINAMSPLTGSRSLLDTATTVNTAAKSGEDAVQVEATQATSNAREPARPVRPPKEPLRLDAAAPIAASGTSIGDARGAKPFAGQTPDVFGLSARRKQVEDLLMSAYSSYDDHVQQEVVTPMELTADLFRAADDRNLPILELLGFYTALIKHLEASPRFQNAILHGVIKPADLARMGKKNMKDIVDQYDKLDETAFLALIDQGTEQTSVRQQPPSNDASDASDNNQCQPRQEGESPTNIGT